MPTIELKSVSNYVFSNLNLEVFDGELLVVWDRTVPERLLYLISLPDWLTTRGLFSLTVCPLIKRP